MKKDKEPVFIDELEEMMIADESEPKKKKHDKLISNTRWASLTKMNAKTTRTRRTTISSRPLIALVTQNQRTRKPINETKTISANNRTGEMAHVTKKQTKALTTTGASTSSIQIEGTLGNHKAGAAMTTTSTRINNMSPRTGTSWTTDASEGHNWENGSGYVSKGKCERRRVTNNDIWLSC